MKADGIVGRICDACGYQFPDTTIPACVSAREFREGTPCHFCSVACARDFWSDASLRMGEVAPRLIRFTRIELSVIADAIKELSSPDVLTRHARVMVGELGARDILAKIVEACHGA